LGRRVLELRPQYSKQKMFYFEKLPQIHKFLMAKAGVHSGFRKKTGNIGAFAA
jgi:hypothetical protein